MAVENVACHLLGVGSHFFNAIAQHDMADRLGFGERRIGAMGMQKELRGGGVREAGRQQLRAQLGAAAAKGTARGGSGLVGG